MMMKKLYVLILSAAMLSILLKPAGGQELFSSQTIHMGVIASDLDRSLEFYQEVIGMKHTGSFGVEKNMAKQSGLSNGIPFEVEVLKLGTGESATRLKLMSFGKRAEKQVNDYIYDHTGIQYITINVHDLAPFIKRIKKHRETILGNGPVDIGGNRYLLLLKDPDGTFIELIGSWRNM
jgi:predicted enzyme related to lactoylglutathione lyase